MNIIKQARTAKDVKILREDVVHRGFCRVDRYEMQHRFFDDSWSPVYTREFLVKPRAIGALPYDPRQDKVVLIEQFRVGALVSDTTPWLIEIVAGLMDQQEVESDEEVVRREMLEEADLEVEALIPMHEYFTSPGCSKEKIKIFCARVDSTKAGKICGVKHEHEDIKTHVVSTQEAFAAVRSGQINNGAAIIALQWLELNLENVNRRWKDLA